jgi:adenylate cyclase, class 2
MANANLETEIKLRIDSLPEILDRLARQGFAVSHPEVFEQNELFDTEDTSLRNRSCLLRIRRAGSACLVTFKGPPIPGAYKVREELEYTASDPDQARAVFERLGYHRTFRYEKYRTEYVAPEIAAVVTVDRTPIGNYLEIESDTDVIDRVALLLGFSPAEYITASYGTLFRDYCELNNAQLRDMVFPVATSTGSTGEKKA